MREILFRGKREDNGEWIEGYLVRRPSAIQVGDRSSPWAIDRPPNDPDDSGEVCFVNGNTVGQFTGLTDKNGMRIFEGDIIKTAEGEIYEVDFRKGCWAGVRSEDEWEFLMTIANRSLIIGNTRDNPELLEVK